MPLGETIFLKLGGSLITDKTRKEFPRLDVLKRLAGEIAEARQRRPEMRLLVGHGSGSYGHFAGREYHTREGILPGQEARGWYGYAATGAAAARLNRLVTDALVEAGLPAVTFQPSATALCRGGELQSIHWRPVVRALNAGLLPVVHGDVAFDDDQGCTIISTEEIFAYLAQYLTPNRILLAGTVDGVYRGDPLRDPGVGQIAVIHTDTYLDLLQDLGESYGVDVTGGMAGKVADMVALVVAQPALVVQILSGETPGAVLQALLDPESHIGTLIVR